MKKLIFIFAIFASAALLAASPAATQEWVRNYVATNSSSGGGVTEEWVRNYVATAVVSVATASADFSTNTVQGIMNNIEMAKILDGAARTNPCMRVSFTTNSLSRMILAQTSETDFVNVPRSATLHLTTNSASFVVGTEYNKTTNVVQEAYVNFGDLSISSALATETEINNAKGL